MEFALTKALQHDVTLLAASRTDRGVHAEGQTVTFFLKKKLPLEKLQYILNALLPKEIRVLKIFSIPKDFHPSLNAIKKEYHYCVQTNKIENPFTRFVQWHYPYPLNIKRMQEGANLFIGKKDFIAFQNSGSLSTSTIREIEKISIELTDSLNFTLIGNSFLYKMVRNIVGTLVYVGQGKIELSELESIIATGLRKNAGICAPAHGLTLKRVFYDFTK